MNREIFRFLLILNSKIRLHAHNGLLNRTYCLFFAFWKWPENPAIFIVRRTTSVTIAESQHAHATISPVALGSVWKSSSTLKIAGSWQRRLSLHSFNHPFTVLHQSFYGALTSKPYLQSKPCKGKAHTNAECVGA